MSEDNLLEEYHHLAVTVNYWLAIWYVLRQKCAKESIVALNHEQKNGVRMLYAIS